MDQQTHLIIKKFLSKYPFDDSTTFHTIYNDFDHKELLPSFKHFVRVLKAMGVYSKSFRRGGIVIRRFNYEPLQDQYLGQLHNLVTCKTCNGTGVVKQ